MTSLLASRSRFVLPGLFALAALGAGASCAVDGDSGAPDIAMPGSSEVAPEAADLGKARVLAEFRGDYDPKTKKFVITRLSDAGADLAAQSIDDAPILQDGVPGSGPPSSVELVTNGDVFVGSGFFQANVTLRHFFPRPINNVFVQVSAISPDDGNHVAIGDDPSEYGLDDTYGLWKYTSDAIGEEGPFGVLGTTPFNAGTRDWYFADDGNPSTYTFRVVYAGSYDSYTPSLSSIDPADPTYNACDGVIPPARPGGAFSTAQLPFQFTLFDFTSRFVAWSARGALAFGTSTTDATTRLPSSSQPNLDLPIGAPLSGNVLKPSILPFWDESLRAGSATSNPDGQVGFYCTKTVGLAPLRQFVISWANFASTAPSSTSPRPGDDYDFSVVLSEGTDAIDIVYHNMITAPANTDGRNVGSSATIGLQARAGNPRFSKHSFNTESIADFGDVIHFSPAP